MMLTMSLVPDTSPAAISALHDVNEKSIAVFRMMNDVKKV
jgi:hypothetical protein